MKNYVSQWLEPRWHEAIIKGSDPCDDPSWKNTGFVDPEYYRFWSRRICGLACLRSILLSRDGHAPKMSLLLEQALCHGVYKKNVDGSVHGLIYRPFCSWIKGQYHIDAEIFEHTDLSDALEFMGEADFLVLSVGAEIRYPFHASPKRGGHLVLVTSCNDVSVIFNNPSGVPPHHADVQMSHERFDRFYSGRGMSISIGG